MLVEAAAIEERERSDYHATQRLLGLALRLRPRDRAIAADFRRVATLALGPTATIAPPPRAATPEAASPIAPIAAPTEPPAAPTEPPAAPLEISPAPPPIRFDSDAPDASSDTSAEDEALAQTLTDRLRGDPDDHATAMGSPPSSSASVAISISSRSSPRAWMKATTTRAPRSPLSAAPSSGDSPAPRAKAAAPRRPSSTK